MTKNGIRCAPIPRERNAYTQSLFVFHAVKDARWKPVFPVAHAFLSASATVAMFLPHRDSTSSSVSTQISGHVLAYRSFRYERHRPETTPLYQLVERHWSEFKAMLSAQSKQLPGFVVREFDDYLKCGRLDSVTESPLFPSINSRLDLPK